MAATQKIDTTASRVAANLSTARLQLLQALQAFDVIGDQLTAAADDAARATLAGVASGSGGEIRDLTVGIGDLLDTTDLTDAEIASRAAYIRTLISEFV